LPPAGSAPGAQTKALSLWQCTYCGHVQLHRGNESPTWKAAVTAAGLSEEMREARLALFQRMRTMTNHAGIWEIGSGEGLFLALLKQAGFMPVGLEWSPELVAKARLCGLDMHEGHVLDGAVDAAHLENVLEHATEPTELLRRLAKASNPDAVFLVEVPDFSKDLATERSHDLVVEHLSYFTPRTLRLCLELAGFEVIGEETFWHGDDIIAWARPRAPYDLHQWHLRDPALHLMTQFCSAPGERVAIWGASHQALTLLSMLPEESVSAVMAIADRSPRKQGRMDPAWGIPIVSPEAMLEMQPTRILILAAGYSEEVARQLRGMGYRGQAAILRDGLLRQIAA